MGFAEFSTPAGLNGLEAHLTHVSYVEGHVPTQADVAVFKALPSAPAAATYPHTARWYAHIQSYESEHATLPGDALKPSTAYGPSTSAPAAVSSAPTPEDDDLDLFGSDDDEVDEEAERVKAARVAEYAAKKAGKTKTIAKSVVTLDVKPWDDETDMVALEACVRSIEQPGLLWGLSSLFPIGYGIRVLRTTLVIEDDLVGLDELQERLVEEFDEYIQSSDVIAMQKL